MSRWNAIIRVLRALFADYSMLAVLLGLGAVLSVLTIAEQQLSGASGGRALARVVLAATEPGARVFIVAPDGAENREFAQTARAALEQNERHVVGMAAGPTEAAEELRALAKRNARVDRIAAHPAAATWSVLDDWRNPDDPRISVPPSHYWPNFLDPTNLLNIPNQIAVFAIIAIGMTLVIITGGIDLSVGSMVGLASVLASWLIWKHAGGRGADTLGIVWCCAAAILATAAIGFLNGWFIARFEIPPFLVTLASMFMVSGAAYQLAQNQTINQVPTSFGWLGQGSDIKPFANPVIVMALLYVVAHFLMATTVWGRHTYAVGSNRRAAYFAGVPVARTIISAYVVTGALAGLGGIVLASTFTSGSPNHGQMFELPVIAIVVVGGASLSGGEGKIFGTLIGAFIIGVIQNGMNLFGVESNAQKIVLGAVILLAALLDRIKKQGFRRPAV